jgi:two-component system alkaline phosphatase synthesis response regulator PhoP
MSRILVVEDNADLAQGIAYNLRLEGYEVRVAPDGRDALDACATWRPDLVLLDLMLPGVNGYDVLRSVRSSGAAPRTPVIILSARAEEADKVRGFKLDADQYVTKPFGVLELLERVASMLRRSEGAAGNGGNGPPAPAFGDVSIDVPKRMVLRHGAEVPLSPKAFELLLALVRRQGAVATRHELLREVWGYGVEVISRTVDTHVAELRRKLEDDPAEPAHIVTVWKVGYRLAR